MKKRRLEPSNGDLELRFDGGFPSVFMASLGVAATAADYEGLDQRGYTTPATLPPELRRDIRTFAGFCGSSRAFARSTTERRDIPGVDGLIDWLGILPDDSIRSLPGCLFENASREGSGRWRYSFDRGSESRGSYGSRAMDRVVSDGLGSRSACRRRVKE